MSYTIPPGSPKAVKAAAFGRELVKACAARDVPLKELQRVTGVGHSSIDLYRRGLLLPKVEVAKALAHALSWPRLGAMIVAARTFACARSGCPRTFRNDTGAPRRYCSDACRRMSEKARAASRQLRRAGQTGDGRTREAAIRQLRSAVAIADERAQVAEAAIAAMCWGCEPEGICRTRDCELRPFSPLPIAVHRIDEASPVTEFDRRSRSWTQARRAKHSAHMERRWADPAWAGPQRAKLQVLAASETPERRAARGRAVNATKRAQVAARSGAEATP